MSTIDTSLSSTIQELGLQKADDSKERNKLGQKEFLDLMVAQLRNQDPFKPLENGDFISQMAQFSSVSSLDNLQSSFNQLATSLQSNQALQASTLVGRSVLVPSSQGILPPNGTLSGVMELEQSSPNVTLTINDSSGQLIRTVSLGSQPGGSVPFTWDGLADDGTVMPPGKYNVKVSANYASQVTDVATLVTASVESVTLNQNNRNITLNLQDLGSIDFSQVKEIK